MINLQAKLSKSQVKAICAKIKKQLPGNCRGEQLFFSVFELAMLDHYCHRPHTYSNAQKGDGDIPRCHHDSASAYLQNAEQHLAAIGIDCDWVDRLINEVTEKRPTICQANPVGPHLH